MSAQVFSAGLALRSRSLGRAVPASARRRVPIHPEAIGIVALAMAGERTGLWGAAFGKIRRGMARQASVGDARDHVQQAGLWHEMAPTILSAGDEPQLVVPSRQTARLLTESASRFRYHEDPKVATAAETVWWCLTRRELPGSHSGVVLTEALAAHYAVGADGGESDDLRVLLAWIGATGPEDLAARIAAREAEPPDPKTTLEFDEALWAKVDAREKRRAARQVLVNKAATEAERRRAERDLQRQAENRAQAVKVALKAPLGAAWSRLRDAAKVLDGVPRPVLAGIEHFCGADQRAWQREVARRERGYSMARRDSPRAAVVGLAEAEVARNLWAGALVWDDPMARAEALAGGDATAGSVMASNEAGFSVAADDGLVRARVGDTLVVDLDGEHVEVELVEVSDEAGTVSLSVEWEGMHEPLPEQSRVVLWPPPPDYNTRWLGWLTKRLAEKHWTLGDRSAPPPTPVSPPSGPQRRLDRVMALRRG